ncbi:MAG: hypothetical protein KME11_21720 [Timaviella obliquedivisa GSE-PSE-MK23-08B]|jgi:hypothetical protein|nr:hypothetical protein [Timaviella obliquedivisa GSE-PSE-MK23-08B]
MLTAILPFSLAINPTALAGVSLWALAIYLGFSPVSDWVMEQLNRWMNFAEHLYTSAEEFERTKSARESQNSFYASLLSIVPFLLVGGLCNWGVEISLGEGWSISIGILACMSCGVYELGRQDGRSQE